MSGRVLVVDDIEVNIRLLEAKLLSEYYDVLTATTGPAALEIARRETPDVILLDIMMPGMDGLEVCRRLKAERETRYTPIVMVTALSDASDRLRALQLGADDFLTKPVNDLALFARVRSLIRLKRTFDEWMLREEINDRFAALPGEDDSFESEAAKPARILLVEESESTRTKLARTLEPLASALSHATRNSDAIQAAVTGRYDLVIVSMVHETDDPLRLVSQLRAAEATRHLPILLIIDDGDHARLAKGLDLGANDYVVRPIDRNELTARARLQIKRKRLQDKLLDNLRRGLSLALTDSLTGLYNRRYLMAHLNTMFERPQLGKGTALLMFDIDRFKLVNDTHGHAVGDEVLVEVSRRAMSSVRGFDLVSRYGGEEFIIVMPECTVAESCLVAERLCRSIVETPIEVAQGAHRLNVTISVGVAAAGGEAPALTPAELIQNADRALYAAKNSGRNCVMLWQQTGKLVPLSPTTVG